MFEMSGTFLLLFGSPYELLHLSSWVVDQLSCLPYQLRMCSFLWDVHAVCVWNILEASKPFSQKGGLLVFVLFVFFCENSVQSFSFQLLAAADFSSACCLEWLKALTKDNANKTVQRVCMETLAEH